MTDVEAPRNDEEALEEILRGNLDLEGKSSVEKYITEEYKPYHSIFWTCCFCGVNNEHLNMASVRNGPWDVTLPRVGPTPIGNGSCFPE